MGADVLFAFEKAEAGRYAHYIKKGGAIIASTQEIMPMTVVAGGEKYPQIFLKFDGKGLNVIKANAAELAESAGNIKAANVALIGFLTKAINLIKKK
jgi:indolepyruvate ferredoxin oxidoreductase beta subunit